MKLETLKATELKFDDGAEVSVETINGRAERVVISVGGALTVVVTPGNYGGLVVSAPAKPKQVTRWRIEAEPINGMTLPSGLDFETSGAAHEFGQKAFSQNVSWSVEEFERDAREGEE